MATSSVSQREERDDFFPECRKRTDVARDGEEVMSTARLGLILTPCFHFHCLDVVYMEFIFRRVLRRNLEKASLGITKGTMSRKLAKEPVAEAWGGRRKLKFFASAGEALDFGGAPSGFSVRGGCILAKILLRNDIFLSFDHPCASLRIDE